MYAFGPITRGDAANMYLLSVWPVHLLRMSSRPVFCNMCHTLSDEQASGPPVTEINRLYWLVTKLALFPVQTIRFGI